MSGKKDIIGGAATETTLAQVRNAITTLTGDNQIAFHESDTPSANHFMMTGGVRKDNETDITDVAVDEAVRLRLTAAGRLRVQSLFEAALGAASLPAGSAVIGLWDGTNLQAARGTIDGRAEVHLFSAEAQVFESSSQSIAIGSSSAAETFTTTTSGTTNTPLRAVKYWSVSVKGTGAGATAWDVRLEGTLDGTNWTQILAHTNADLDGTLKPLTTPFPATSFRLRCAGLTLGGATNIIARCVGCQ